MLERKEKKNVKAWNMEMKSDRLRLNVTSQQKDGDVTQKTRQTEIKIGP